MQTDKESKVSKATQENKQKTNTRDVFSYGEESEGYTKLAKKTMPRT